jgi:hypothetical protein
MKPEQIATAILAEALAHALPASFQIISAFPASYSVLPRTRMVGGTAFPASYAPAQDFASTQDAGSAARAFILDAIQ